MSKTKAHIRYKNSKCNILPGVTTIIGILAKPALIHWSWKLGIQGIDYRKFRDEKADAGTLGHLFIMNHLRKRKTDTSEYSKKVINMAENSFLSFLEWEKEHKLEPILIEAPLVDEEWGYGGTPDYFGFVNGNPELIDFKTGSGIYDEYIIQVAAYQQLVINSDKTNELPEKVRILRIPRSNDEAFEEKLLSGKELKVAWNIFLSCLTIYKLKKELKGKR